MFSHVRETSPSSIHHSSPRSGNAGHRLRFSSPGTRLSGAVRIMSCWTDFTAVWGFWGLLWHLRRRPTNLQKTRKHPLTPLLNHPPTELSVRGSYCFGGFVVSPSNFLFTFISFAFFFLLLLFFLTKPSCDSADGYGRARAIMMYELLPQRHGGHLNTTCLCTACPVQADQITKKPGRKRALYYFIIISIIFVAIFIVFIY